MGGLAAREREAERRALQERLRISRELHDAIAHTVTGTGVQARVLDDSRDTHPEHARYALARIRTPGDRPPARDRTRRARDLRS